MFRINPLSDIIHLLDTIPVNLQPVLAMLPQHKIEETAAESSSDLDWEQRYSLAEKISAYMLTSSRDIEPGTSKYVRYLISHLARNIVLPFHLLPLSVVASKGISELAELFQVPVAVVTKRLTDADLKGRVAPLLRSRGDMIEIQPALGITVFGLVEDAATREGSPIAAFSSQGYIPNSTAVS